MDVRPVEMKDLDAVRSLRMDPKVSAWLFSPSVPISEQAQYAWFDELQESETRYFFVGCREGTIVGYCQLHVDVFHRLAELGVVVGSRYWCKGYGTGLTRWLLRFAFVTLCLEKVKLELFKGNVGARALYEKVGFKIEGELKEHYLKEGRRRDVLVMGLLRECYAT